MRRGQMRAAPALAAALFFAPAPCRAAGTGLTAGPLLEESFGGRPMAMGQAYVAVADDLFGMAFNPAGLSQIDRAQLAAQYASDVVDIKKGYFGLALPLPRSQTLAVSYA